jgi:transposase
MVLTYKRKRQVSYSQEDLHRAVESVQGGMTISEASRMFSIPRGTVTDNMKSFLKKKWRKYYLYVGTGNEYER